MKKNRNIMLAALSVAALTLFASCNKEPVTEIVPEPEESAAVHSIPATIGAVRSADDPSSKAQFNTETSKLEFTSGDKLFISGTHSAAGQFSGVLDYVDGSRFKGDIYTQNDATELSYHDLLSDATSVKAQLLPKDYESKGFLSVTGTEEYSKEVTTDPSKCFALSKEGAIEQFSCEVSTTYDSAQDLFSLEPQNCVITFIIGGLEADAAYANVKVSSVTTTVDSEKKFTTFNDSAEDAVHITGSVSADDSGTATVAVAFKPGATARTYTLFIGDVPTVSLSNKSYIAGTSYRVNRPTLSAADPAGTKGMYNGREAMRVDLDVDEDGNKEPYVVATMNESARTEEDYGPYNSGTNIADYTYTYAEALKNFTDGSEDGADDYKASGVWRLPTKDELASFAKLTNSLATQNEVKGKLFTVVTGKTLFLPAAGYTSSGYPGLQGNYGQYWSSTLSGPMYEGQSDCLYFGEYDKDNCNVGSYFRTFGLSVRLFCALP